MCGIVAKIDFTGAPADATWLNTACELIAHRGPDSQNTYIAGGDPRPTVSFGHRRLRIIDLSPLADQPMHNSGCVAANRSRALVVIFNGEIYNYRELRSRLASAGHRFTSESDTEVLLHLYEEHGADCVRLLRGMYAFAIWDAEREELFAARDRVGKKPLYYRFDGSRLWLASEPRAILADPEVSRDVDAGAVRAYLELGYIPSPLSAHATLRRLPPAHYLTASARGLVEARYWQLRHGPKSALSEHEAAEQLRALLSQSVAVRMIADVPVGAFLSGGIDSSAVVGLMQESAAGRIKTFSIGFEDDAFNELPHARVVAEHFGTDHHEFIVRPDAAAVLPKLAWHYGEPFADSSAVPTYYLAELARQHITVALTGDGGDENFAGYRRYRAHLLAAKYERLPLLIRSSFARLSRAVPAAASRSLGYDLKRFFEAASQTAARRYAGWFGFFSDLPALLAPEFSCEGVSRDDPIRVAFQHASELHPVDAAMSVDIATYLPDDLLVKLDISTMAHGLEARSPLLDHEMMEFAAQLPVGMKLRGGVHKYILKQAVEGIIPSGTLSRKKVGFGVPLDRWLRAELADFARDVLLASVARARGYFRPGVVERLLAEHLSGSAAHGHRIWALLMLELWHHDLTPPARLSRLRAAGAATERTT